MCEKALPSRLSFSISSGCAASNHALFKLPSKTSSPDALDPTFGTGGKVVTDMTDDNFTRQMQIQPDGKIIALGDIADPNAEPFDIGLARFLPNAPAAPPFFDFDGDGRADVSVFRQGNWYRINSNDNPFNGTQFGAASDKIAPADYDGDRRSDLAVFREGVWYILQSSTNSLRAVSFGQAGDVPVPGDYDGDGRADRAVYRGGNWYVLNSANNSFRAVRFGAASDTPIQTTYLP